MPAPSAAGSNDAVPRSAHVTPARLIPQGIISTIIDKYRHLPAVLTSMADTAEYHQIIAGGIGVGRFRFPRCQLVTQYYDFVGYQYMAGMIGSSSIASMGKSRHGDAGITDAASGYSSSPRSTASHEWRLVNTASQQQLTARQSGIRIRHATRHVPGSSAAQCPSATARLLSNIANYRRRTDELAAHWYGQYLPGGILVNACP